MRQELWCFHNTSWAKAKGVIFCLHRRIGSNPIMHNWFWSNSRCRKIITPLAVANEILWKLHNSCLSFDDFFFTNLILFKWSMIARWILVCLCSFFCILVVIPVVIPTTVTVTLKSNFLCIWSLKKKNTCTLYPVISDNCGRAIDNWQLRLKSCYDHVRSC